MLKTQITTRLFVGCVITSELKMHLNKSIKWKHTNILASKSPTDLRGIHHAGKDYIGLYSDQDKYTVAELKKLLDTIKQQLKIYCPEIDIEKVKSTVFPQVFIA